MKDRFIFISTLVLQHSVVLLLLIFSCGGQLQVIGPSQPIVAIVGDDIILPCHLEPAVTATDLTVEWARPDLNPRFVHLRRDGVELLLEEHPLYTGRTSLSMNNLKRGDISLKLSEVKLSDAGTYRCLIPTFGTGSVVELAVGSVSSPEVDISKVTNGVLLKCKSGGWYPEPELSWLDGEGDVLPAGRPETVRGPDGLYTVGSRVTVEKRHGSSFTCRVQQKNINQTREIHIYVPADFFMAQLSSAVRITICSAVCFLSIVAVVFIVLKGGRNKIKTTNLRDEPKPAKFDEELQENDKDLQHVEEVITALENQEKDLQNLREKLVSLQQVDETLTEKKMKLPLIHRDKKRQKHEKAKEDLERRQTEFEELLQNTDKLLDTTKNLITTMTDMKVKSER